MPKEIYKPIKKSIEESLWKRMETREKFLMIKWILWEFIVRILEEISEEVPEIIQQKSREEMSNNSWKESREKSNRNFGRNPKRNPGKNQSREESWKEYLNKSQGNILGITWIN